MSDSSAWRVLQSRQLLDHSPWLKVIAQQVELPSGAVIDDYLLTPGRDFSLIVAVMDSTEVLLVRQYKHGIERPLLEFPAGYLDSPDEAPLACARRELREETGYEARDWLSLGAFCIDPNRARTAAHFFLARGLRRAGNPRPDATEDLECLAVPVDRIAALLRSGEMPSLACAAGWGLAVPHLAALTSQR
jgi:ADP-ribose pyrophosphatase